MLKKKNLIFIGAPGAGKGTFSELLMADEPVVHISTGDLLRNEIKLGTELGRAASELMERGQLVPDQVVCGMVRNRLSQNDCEKGFILDGFPRTVKQAEMLDEILKEVNRPLDDVVYLALDEATILERLTSRICCRSCGAIYNRCYMPTKIEGICDKCGGETFQRPDDTLETAQKRLSVFYASTQPVIEYYRSRGLLFTLSEPAKAAAYAILLQELR